MIYVGIDDTDMPDAPGTNQLARSLAAELAGEFPCALIVRHQLLKDPRVPCTSKNSAAALFFAQRDDTTAERLARRLRCMMRQRCVAGSDPGLCVAKHVSEAIVAFGRRCQRELVAQQDARRLARRYGVSLEGLGGTEDGVVGALAAVGLSYEGNDGRVVQIADWPDDLSGCQPMGAIRRRGVEILSAETGSPIEDGTIDVGKHLRPNYRQKRTVLFVKRETDRSHRGNQWRAVRLD